MNGFTMTADTYKKLMEQGKVNKETAEKEIRIYEFLGSCSENDFYRLFDSSAFNEIAKSYMRLAVRELMEEGTLDEEQGRAVRNRYALLFDEKKAREVLQNG